MEGQNDGQETAATLGGPQVSDCAGSARSSKTISQLSNEHETLPNMIRDWKRQLLEDGPSVFASIGERKQRQQEAQETELYEQMAAARPLRIGQLKMELEWLKKNVACFGP